MFESLMAGLGLAVCLLLLAHPMLPARQRARLDRIGRAARAAFGGLRGWPQRWRSRRRPAQRLDRSVEREAHDVIERARRKARRVQRDGNVYRPDSFDRPPTKHDRRH